MLNSMQNGMALKTADCLFSPLQFLYWYDKPSPSMEEPELEFFDNVPTVWDVTKVLHSKIGEYGVIARKKGNEWFIGGINGEEARTLEIRFSFLSPGVRYSAKIYSDDPSVNTRTHVRIETIAVESKDTYTAKMNVNNGFAMHLKPIF